MAASLLSLSVTYFITMATNVDKWDIDHTICRLDQIYMHCEQTIIDYFKVVLNRLSVLAMSILMDLNAGSISMSSSQWAVDRFILESVRTH